MGPVTSAPCSISLSISQFTENLRQIRSVITMPEIALLFIPWHAAASSTRPFRSRKRIPHPPITAKSANSRRGGNGPAVHDQTQHNCHCNRDFRTNVSACSAATQSPCGFSIKTFFFKQCNLKLITYQKNNKKIMSWVIFKTFSHLSIYLMHGILHV